MDRRPGWYVLSSTASSAYAVFQRPTTISDVEPPVRVLAKGSAVDVAEVHQSEDGHTWCRINQPCPGWVALGPDDLGSLSRLDPLQGPGGTTLLLMASPPARYVVRRRAPASPAPHFRAQAGEVAAEAVTAPALAPVSAAVVAALSAEVPALAAVPPAPRLTALAATLPAAPIPELAEPGRRRGPPQSPGRKTPEPGSPESAMDLRKEVERLRRELDKRERCSVCLEAKREVCLQPCGHCCVCSSCAARLASCPMCRSAIESTLRAYFD